MCKPTTIIRCGNLLGECVLWDERAAALWWTDILSKHLYRLDWSRQSLRELLLPERLGSFGFIADRPELIAAFESGVALYHPFQRTVQWLLRPDAQPVPWRFNDGRVDRQGRFWTGTMLESGALDGEAMLYRVDASCQVTCQERGLRITNGLCASPDGRRLYLADSARSIIYKYDLDPSSGALTNRKIFTQTASGVCPDGAAMDESGCLWSAHWGAGCVVRYRPDGSVDRVLRVQVTQPTCVAFGGSDLDLLFVTSARVGLTEETLMREPHAGDVLVYRVNVKGLPESRYRYDGGLVPESQAQ